MRSLVPMAVSVALVVAVLVVVTIGGPDTAASIGSFLQFGGHARLAKAGAVVVVLLSLAAWGRRGRVPSS